MFFECTSNTASKTPWRSEYVSWRAAKSFDWCGAQKSMVHMKYSIWRISPTGEEILLSTVGSTTNRERAVQKARYYNERLRASDPETEDRFIARDERGRELKTA